MLSEEDLAAAAAAIRSMPKAIISQRLAQLEAERERRSDFSAASQDAEFDSAQLDEAAYRLASEYHARGKLREAARWYRAAALNDYADAALQLGYVLEGLAEKYIESPSTPQVARDELALVEDPPGRDFAPRPCSFCPVPSHWAFQVFDYGLRTPDFDCRPVPASEIRLRSKSGAAEQMRRRFDGLRP